ncbi:LysR family transcriptional regulator [Fuscibacter oryzae]|uniref:LysR family transcriptional regulator n=1 Tax=Fuscibacter oryzae TaxID=2803939 RepID=A0A8J7MUQ7_9RHOB|nr:LysR family transcriptional regulator [Fuscibacter oryzae]MBL4927799.1 LysR family transcriptional regulator [Fuscibacter oryzae]
METAVLRTFLHIVDEGSFAEAARRMGISKSLCSKYISDLEASLGARLLTRSTRSVKPTAVGLDYSARVREILAQLDEATEAVRAVSAKPSGPLKIGAPVFYTLRVLQPHMLKFIEQHPDIQLEAVLDDERADLVGDSFDAVIRIGNLDDSGLFARHLHDVRLMLVASPGYLAEHGVPAKPEDLTDHRSIYYTNLRGSGTWPFRKGNEVVHQKIVPVFQTNNGELVRAAAMDGKGIAMMPMFMIDEELRDGRLVPILTDFFLPDVPVNLIYPSRRHMTAALRAFMEFMSGLKLR